MYGEKNERNKVELSDIVANSTGYTSALTKIGVDNKGDNFRTLRRRMIKDEISFIHFSKPGHNLQIYNRPAPIETVLVVNSTRKAGGFKLRLFKLGLLKEKCDECGLGPEWNGKAISLQIDHINGENTDNRIENLRILCPNCHSQTATFAGRSFRKHTIKKCQCGKVIAQKSEQCKPCEGRSKRGIGKPKWRKVVRPSKEELEKLVWEKPPGQLAKDFGVSEPVIRKWRKFYGITSYPRNSFYWRNRAYSKT